MPQSCNEAEERRNPTGRPLVGGAEYYRTVHRSPTKTAYQPETLQFTQAPQIIQNGVICTTIYSLGLGL